MEIDPDNQSKELDAGGVNDDWPVGRGVFIQDDKDFVVQVNFEDHLQMTVLPNRANPNDGFMYGL